jgi:membrane protease YdiL (CAAX protease family)
MSVPPPSTTEPGSGPSQPPPEQADVPSWPAWTAPAAIGLGLGLGVFADVVLAVIASAGGSSLSHPTPAVSLLGDLLFDLSFVGAALYFAAAQGLPRPAEFGYVRPPWRLGLGAFLVGGGGYYLVTLLYASVFALHGKDKLPSELGTHKSTAALVGAAVFVCVVAPIAEEFFFRGFLFGVLRRWRGPWVAVLLTSVLFGLVHAGSASPQYLVPLGLFGVALCLLRWRTGSLYPGMALHSLNNALALGVNDLHWSAAGILGLMLAAIATIGALTLPLSSERAAAAVRPVPGAP